MVYENGWIPEEAFTISSPCEPNGSGLRCNITKTRPCNIQQFFKDVKNK